MPKCRKSVKSGHTDSLLAREMSVKLADDDVEMRRVDVWRNRGGLEEYFRDVKTFRLLSLQLFEVRHLLQSFQVYFYGLTCAARKNIFFKWPLFVYFRSFLITITITQIEKA